MEQPKITDEEIETVFAGTSFGGCNRRELLAQGVLKRFCGYSCGSTLTHILDELRLITQNGTITKRGKQVLINTFYRSNTSA